MVVSVVRAIIISLTINDLSADLENSVDLDPYNCFMRKEVLLRVIYIQRSPYGIEFFLGGLKTQTDKSNRTVLFTVPRGFEPYRGRPYSNSRFSVFFDNYADVSVFDMYFCREAIGSYIVHRLSSEVGQKKVSSSLPLPSALTRGTDCSRQEVTLGEQLVRTLIQVLCFLGHLKLSYAVTRKSTLKLCISKQY